MTVLSTSRARSGLLWSALVVSLAVAGCNDAKRKVDSSSNLKDLSVAAIQYQADNKAWPDTLDQLKSEIGKNGPLGPIGSGKDFATLIKNPLTGDNPGYEYVKPKDSSSSSSIILYQLRAGKRDPSLPVAYADGSVREAGQ